MIVNQAEAIISQAVSKALAEIDDLTHLELLDILNGIQGRWLKYALRAERHPNDPDKRADEE
jgi:hypothetical protein